VKLTDAIDNMLEKGMTPRYVSYLTGVALEDVAKRPNAAIRFAPSEDDLDAAMSDLIWNAYEEAHEMVKWGSPAVRLRIIGWLLGPAARTLGKDRDHRNDELRETLQSLIEPEDLSGDADPDDFNPSLTPAIEPPDDDGD
jgi:hypothetical protein